MPEPCRRTAHGAECRFRRRSATVPVADRRKNPRCYAAVGTGPTDGTRRRGPQLGGPVTRERRAVHHGERRRARGRRGAQRRHRSGAEGRGVEDLLGADRRLDDVVGRHRRPVADVGEQVAGEQRAVVSSNQSPLSQLCGTCGVGRKRRRCVPRSSTSPSPSAAADGRPGRSARPCTPSSPCTTSACGAAARNRFIAPHSSASTCRTRSSAGRRAGRPATASDTSGNSCAHAGVEQERLLVADEELVEREAGRRRDLVDEGGEPEDVGGDLVDPGVHRSSSSEPRPLRAAACHDHHRIRSAGRRHRVDPPIGDPYFGGVLVRRERRRLRPTADAQLGQDAADVVLGGLRRDEQLRGDLGVAVALAYEVEHLDSAAVNDPRSAGTERSRIRTPTPSVRSSAACRVAIRGRTEPFERHEHGPRLGDSVRVVAVRHEHLGELEARGSGEQRSLAGDEVPLGRFERFDRGTRSPAAASTRPATAASAPSTGLSVSAAITVSWSAASCAASMSPCASSASTSNANKVAPRNASPTSVPSPRRRTAAAASGSLRPRLAAAPTGRTRRCGPRTVRAARRLRRAGPVRHAAARVSQPCRRGARSSSIPSGRALRSWPIRPRATAPRCRAPSRTPRGNACAGGAAGRRTGRAPLPARGSSTLPPRRTSPTRSHDESIEQKLLPTTLRSCTSPAADRGERHVETVEALVHATLRDEREAAVGEQRAPPDATSSNSAAKAAARPAAQEIVDVGPLARHERELEVAPLHTGPDRFEQPPGPDRPAVARGRVPDRHVQLREVDRRPDAAARWSPAAAIRRTRAPLARGRPESGRPCTRSRRAGRARERRVSELDRVASRTERAFDISRLERGTRLVEQFRRPAHNEDRRGRATAAAATTIPAPCSCGSFQDVGV